MGHFENSFYSVILLIALVSLFRVSTTSAKKFETFVSDAECNTGTKDVTFSRDYTGVYFEPYVIFQDQFDPNYYDESGLAILLKKVNTKFNHIMICYTDMTTYFKTSPKLVPIVAAKINQQMASSESILFLTIRFTSALKCKGSGAEVEQAIMNFTAGILELKAVLDEANSIYPGTIHKIIYELQRGPPATNFLCGYKHFRQAFQNQSKFEFGLNIDIKACAQRKSNYEQFFEFPLHGIYYTSIYDHYVPSTVVDTTEIMLQEFESCKLTWEKAFSESDKPTLSFITAWTDTDINIEVGFNNTVYFWSAVDNWAKKTNTSTFIFSAFDKFQDDRPYLGKEASGWWRVIPNSSFVHPSQFQFEEKRCLPNPPKLFPEMINISYLEKPLIFNQNVGIYVEFSTLREYVNQVSNPCDTFCLRQLINSLFSSFSILVVKEYESIIDIAQIVANNNVILNKPTELMVASTSLNLGKINDAVYQANLIYNGIVKSIVHPVTTSLLINSVVNITSIRELNIYNVKQAFVLNAEYLLDRYHFKRLGAGETNVFNLADIILIEKKVSENDVKKDIKELLLHYTIMFEVCIGLVHNRNKSIEVGIITGWPDVKLERLEEILPFIDYWEGINSWAENKDFKVIMTDAFDYRKGGRGRNGWWRFVENGTIPDSAEKLEYQNKKQIALKLAKDWLDSIAQEDNKRIDFFASWKNMTLLLLAIILMVIATFGMAYLKLRRSQKIIDDFVKGSGREIIVGIGMDGSIADFDWSYDKALYEISRNNFAIKRDVHLGYGQFGIICEAVVERNGVAVKAAVKEAKTAFSDAALNAVLSEIKLMIYLGKHANVVELIGAYTSELRRRKAFIFLEMCELGSLESYLKNQNAEELIPNLSRWAYGISNGMEYIASKRVVHLDLATRNVLLTSEKVTKISDFGLSRRLHNYDFYAKKKQEPLPWRWMSIEALGKLEFSEKSDVWAFGVTMWEIFSLGEVPFKSDAWGRQFLTKLEQGERLKRPAYCQLDDKDVFPLMWSCWDADKNKRPTFSFLKNKLFHFIIG